MTHITGTNGTTMEISVKDNDYFNMSIGTIHAPELKDATIQEIMEMNTHIKSVERLMKKFDKEKTDKNKISFYYLKMLFWTYKTIFIR